MARTNKTLELVGRRVRVLTPEGRTLVGQLLAYDKHMNVVLADAEEFRRTKRSERRAAALGGSAPAEAGKATEGGAMRRTLGLVVLRGKHVSALTPDGASVPVDANRPAGPSVLPSFPSRPV